MEIRAAVMPAVHMLLAGCIAVVAVIGLLGADNDGARVIGDYRLAWLVVLPMVGIVTLGLYDWQAGRGATILRAADLAAFALGVVELSLGTTGFARWLAGAIALLAAAGIAASFLIERPRRAGFRR
jgi:hypothetical protein